MSEIARYAIQRLREPGNWVVDCFVATNDEIRRTVANSKDIRILDLELRQIVPYPQTPPRPGMARWYPKHEMRGKSNVV